MTPDLSPEAAIAAVMPYADHPEIRALLARDTVRALGEAGYVILKRPERPPWCAPDEELVALYRVKPDA